MDVRNLQILVFGSILVAITGVVSCLAARDGEAPPGDRKTLL